MLKTRFIVLAFAALALIAMSTVANAAGCPKMAGKASCGMVCPNDCPKDCKLCPNPGNCPGPCMKSCTKASAGASLQSNPALGITVHQALSHFANQSFAIAR
jgi:hypothetical protein